MKSACDEYDNRLRVLEEKLAYQEYTVDQLNDVVVSQQKQLDELEEKYRLLKEKIMSEILKADAIIDNPRPPHY